MFRNKAFSNIALQVLFYAIRHQNILVKCCVSIVFKCSIDRFACNITLVIPANRPYTGLYFNQLQVLVSDQTTSTNWTHVH